MSATTPIFSEVSQSASTPKPTLSVNDHLLLTIASQLSLISLRGDTFMKAMQKEAFNSVT